MLNKDDITKIAAVLKMDSDTLAAAITSAEETAIEMPEVSVFTAAELKARDNNTYAAGKTAGEDMLVKSVKEAHGLTVEGKDMNKVLDVFKANVLKAANIEPDKKLEEANRVAETLRANLTKAETERDGAVASMRSMGLQTKVLSSVEGEYLLPPTKVLNLMQSEGYAIDESDGAVVFKLHGEIVRDAKTQNPVLPGKVIADYATAQNLVKEVTDAKKGRGSGNSGHGTGAPTKLSELIKQYEAEGKSIHSAEFSARATDLAKDNPEFMDI